MVNKVILIGRVGQRPTVMTAKTGTAIGNMSLATNKRIKGVDKTEWHRIKLFGKTAEFARERLGKGALVYIEGELQTHKWDKEGHTHYTTEVICNDLKVQEWGNQAGKEHDRPAEINGNPINYATNAVDTSFDDNFDLNDVPF